MANHILTKLFGNYSKRELKRIQPLVNKVLGLEDTYKELSDEQLKDCTRQFKERLEKGETLDDILPEAFAACREAMDRVLAMRPLPGADSSAASFSIRAASAEMKTGEGKTLVAQPCPPT